MRTGGRCVQCPEFRELLTYARPGDTVHISEMFRLVRATGHILDVLDVLHRDQVAPRIHDGAFSAVDLTARHPRTGELLSTVKFMAQTLATAGELQRDLQRELTYDGLRAAETKGSEGGRRPAVPADKTDDVRAAYVPAPELPVTLDMPGKVADFLRTAELGPAERAVLDQGVPRTARPGPRPARQHHPGRPPPTPRPLPAPRRPPGTSAVPARRKAAAHTRTASAPSEPRPGQDHRLSADGCSVVPRGRIHSRRSTGTCASRSALHVPSIQFAQPNVSWELDGEQPQARKARTALLEPLTTPGYIGAGAHLDSPGVGHVTRKGTGYALEYRAPALA
ncbi:recombinase family protein [Streptomyces sp. WAC05858]|uniref:recombinase family protein n=1 Tax=Streptomyces TaxID=1883 RepID=UPI0021B01D7B|nr:recombinase family protein [Streptomyces sp. WAC05858]